MWLTCLKSLRNLKDRDVSAVTYHLENVRLLSYNNTTLLTRLVSLWLLDSYVTHAYATNMKKIEKMVGGQSLGLQTIHNLHLRSIGQKCGNNCCRVTVSITNNSPSFLAQPRQTNEATLQYIKDQSSPAKHSLPNINQSSWYRSVSKSLMQKTLMSAVWFTALRGENAKLNEPV